MNDSEFDAFVAESVEYMRRAIEECNRQWDFQSYRQWDLDLNRRVLEFSDGPKPPIDCDFRIAGTYLTTRNIWRWSWDNPSIEPELQSSLEKVRAFGEANDVPRLTVGGWEAEDEEAAWVMTAVAAKLVGAKSVYRAPDETRLLFLLITAVRWAQVS